MIIYKITNTINGKVYIGQSQYPLERRWTLHKSDAKRNVDNIYFHKAIRKYDPDCWELEILEEIDDIDFLNETEMKWIEYYDSMNPEKGYNLTSGGDNGYIFTQEIKNKISYANKGRISPMKGRFHSKETKEKMRQKALNMTEKHKKNISLSKLNHIVTQETKNKISLNNARSGNRKGMILSLKTRQKMSEAAKKKGQD